MFSLLLIGWAADPGAGIASVNILIDGNSVGSATLGLADPALAESRNNPAFVNSGWSFTASAAGFAVGTHTVSAVVTGSQGATTTLGPLSFSVAATAAPGPPLGALNEAIDATTRSATVSQSDNLLVTGWAADPAQGAPVSQVAILIDGNSAGNATLGFARPDVAAGQHNSAYLNSGWSFTGSISTLSLGAHTVTAVATDASRLSTTLGSATITVSAAPMSGPPFGSLDKAVDATSGSATVSQRDNLLVTGWAADPAQGAPVSQVAILIDGNSAGNATLGFARPDVAAGQHNSAYLNSGWSFTGSISTLSLGAHTVRAVATDAGGQSTTLGTLIITVTP